MTNLFQKSLLLLSLLLVINVTLLNVLIVRNSKTSEAKAMDQSFIVCDSLCQKNVAVLIHDQRKNEPTQTPFIVQKEVLNTKKEPREYLLSLGSGSTQSDNWIQLPGVEIIIDTTKYPPIKQAYFETYLSIPTAGGYAHAKLVNVTDKHDVWFSEVTMEADSIVRHEVPITLTPGEKRYAVMMKSTLQRTAILHNARIKIVTE